MSNSRQVFGTNFTIEAIIAAVVAAVIFGTLAFAIIRSFTKRGKRASQREKYTKVEAVYLLAIAGVAAFLIQNSFMSNGNPIYHSDPPKGSHPLTVNIVAFQWCWRFEYPGTGVSVTGTCVTKDNLPVVSGPTIPVLRVPTGRLVVFHIRSTDVIHAWWVPYLRFKRYAYPNFVSTFNETLHHTGIYSGRCAEFCGLHHDTMDFQLQAMTPAKFAAWLHSAGGRTS